MHLIKEIIQECDKRYSKSSCSKNLIYCKTTCDGNPCEKCLSLIHFQHGPGRKYDCTRMADFYVAQFACKYTSEILYAIQTLQLPSTFNANVLSIGCGPCTDLFAFEYWLQKKKISSLQYHGFEINPIWGNIHNDIISAANAKKLRVDIITNPDIDVFYYIKDTYQIPNIIVLQYVLSDIYKQTPAAINSFITQLADYFNNTMPTGSVIILNDVNSCNCGRDHFDKFFLLLNNCTATKRHFANNYNDSIGKHTYYYGNQYPHNHIDYKAFLDDYALDNKYSSKRYCSSAQCLIKKW